ncbi:CBU_0592 family membrane protein [Corynebacterium uberis]|uniref:CBU_0592 family membrane protein n=1 Tax=Corynebacterium TaxID=1716 RepID=UPI001D0A6243|nr:MULTISPECIES: transporter [Corynebacterium]MCZ9309025.1 transporter [Corynebacterium sp. c6VSa_13]UDL74508.1 transporter [Corynebacterium uberis]UDL76657.1 transporter [Corynebacterium uberis]UDL78870.1 transporter [Corynebacterium uberis]UDL81148.1 transporter [Corynebacterium uberis]
MMPLSAPVSLFGTVCFLAAFGALNAGLLKSDSYLYQSLNLVGAACFTYTAISPFNPGLFITEFVWAVFGAYGIFKIYRTAMRRKASA